MFSNDKVSEPERTNQEILKEKTDCLDGKTLVIAMGAIKRGPRTLGVWPGQSSPPRNDLSTRAYYSLSGCLLVVAHLTRSPLWGTVHL